MTAELLKRCSHLLPGDNLGEVLAGLRELARVRETVEKADSGEEHVFEIDGLDFSIPSLDGETVEAIQFGPAFPGTINQIRMGMTGDEVEAILGPPDRLWPMPHPNYVLL
jgi:hypothetical protein